MSTAWANSSQWSGLIRGVGFYQGFIQVPTPFRYWLNIKKQGADHFLWKIYVYLPKEKIYIIIIITYIIYVNIYDHIIVSIYINIKYIYIYITH